MQRLGVHAVVVTGCSSGIGRATAIELAERGFTVFATVRKETDAAALRGIERIVPICPLDLTKRAQIDAAVRQITAELAARDANGLAGCVNNAGGGGVAPIELLDADQFAHDLRARLAGPVALVQGLLPMLRAAGGRVVWVATPATIPTPYVTSIHAADFAVNCIARTLDIELNGTGVRSVQVRCGGVRTATGLSTARQVERILGHPNAQRYRAALEAWSADMVAFDAKRAAPELVAAQIARALSDRRPRRRYRVGHMSGAAALLEFLPQPLADAVLQARFRRGMDERKVLGNTDRQRYD